MTRPEDLAAALVRRHERRRKPARAGAVRARLDEALAAAPSPRARRAWLIGSLAWGGFDATSDVDVVVDGLDVEAAVALGVHLVRELPAMPQVLRLEELPASFRDRVLAEGIPPGVAG